MTSLRYPWDTEPAPVVIPPDPDGLPSKPKPRGRRPAAVTRAAAGMPTTAADFRYHHLTISGPAEAISGIAAAARGAGVTPWRLDFAAIEEGIFVRAIPSLARSVARPAIREKQLSVAGCRILARQFRERVEAHHARAVALVGHSVACPFDLHALLPVPATILQLGPSHPAALAWLSTHWGTDRLRQVVRRTQATTGRRLPRGHAVIGYGFFTHGETPHAAMDALAPRWPALRFRLVPRPPD